MLTPKVTGPGSKYVAGMFRPIELEALQVIRTTYNCDTAKALRLAVKTLARSLESKAGSDAPAKRQR